MVAISEATMIYNMRIVPSYISSNGYYGYVPLVNERFKHRSNHQQVQLNNNQQQQQHHHHDELQLGDQETNPITNGHDISMGASSHYHQCNDEHYDYNNPSAMETDGDEKTYIEETQHCQNNDCVIPETARHLINGDGASGGAHLLYQMATNNNNNNTGTINQRESRKRNSYDDPAFLIDHGIGQMKKLRQGGGNSQVIHGAGSTRKFGSTAVLNEPSSLSLVSNITSSPKSYTKVANDCYVHAVAGTNTIDYEKMLLETHGCSIYHHYRHQLQYSDIVEAEF